MEIRQAQLAELEQIRGIYNHSIVHTTSVYHYEPFSKEKMQEWWDNKDKDDLPILVAAENETVCGFASYGSFRPWPGYLFTVEHSVHVHPDHRRKGVAKLLLLELMDIAKSKGMHTMIGGIDAGNATVLPFMKTWGLKNSAILKQVGFKFDKWLDLALMQKML